MAATATIKDGRKFAFAILNNRDTDETSAAVQKVDISGLSAPTGQACTAIHIRRIWYNIGGNAVDLFFDATTDQHAWTLHQGSDGYIDFRDSATIKPSNTAAAGFTGDLMLQVRGTHAAATTGYSITLELEKFYG